MNTGIEGISKYFESKQIQKSEMSHEEKALYVAVKTVKVCFWIWILMSS